MTLDTAVLADLAAKATPGPWSGDDDGHVYPEAGPVTSAVRARGMIADIFGGRHAADAAYIAAFSPDVAAALLAEVESLRKAAPGSATFREAVRSVFEAPGEWGPAQGYYAGDIDHFIDMLRAALVSEEGSRTR